MYLFTVTQINALKFEIRAEIQKMMDAKQKVNESLPLCFVLFSSTNIKHLSIKICLIQMQI